MPAIVRSVNSAASSSNSFSIAVALPAHLAGDLLVVAVCAGTSATWGEAPAGWTAGTSISASGISEQIYWLYAEGDATANPTFTYTAAVIVKTTYIAVSVLGASGNPVIVALYDAVSDVNWNIPAVTAGSVSLRLGFVFVNALPSSVTPTGGWTGIISESATANFVSNTGGSGGTRRTQSGQFLSSSTLNPPGVAMVSNVAVVNVGHQIAIAELLPPAATSGLSATAINNAQINLGWTDNSSNETGFSIERAPDVAGAAGTYAEIATVGAGVTTYADTALTASTKYWYRVRAFNDGGFSAYSASATATTAAGGPVTPIVFYVPGDTGYTHTRNSTAPFTDQNGLEQTAAIDVLRDAHYIGGVRRTLVAGTSANQAAVDELVLPWSTAPATTLTFYSDFIWQGWSGDNSGEVIWGIGGISGAFMYLATVGSFFFLLHNKGSAANQLNGPNVALTVGDRIRLRAVFHADGSMELHHTINDEAEVSVSKGNGGIVPEAAWGTNQMQVGQFDGGLNLTMALTKHKVAVGVVTRAGMEAPETLKATLTGVQATSSVGTLTARVALKATITGVEATSAAGTLSGKVALKTALTGVEATAAVGSLVGSITVVPITAALTGVESVASVGMLVGKAASKVTLTGVQAQGSVGTLTGKLAIRAQIVGIEANAAVGSMSASVATSVTLTRYADRFTASPDYADRWTNAANAYSDDNVYATADPAQSTNHADLFGFPAITAADIPDGSTINSITFEVGFFVSTADSEAYLGLASYLRSIWIGNETIRTDEPTTEALAGIPWGAGATVVLPTLADLREAGAIQCQARARRGNNVTPVTFSLDWVRVVINYTAPVPQPITATITGVQTTGGIGTLAGKVAVHAQITGVQASTSVGTLTAVTTAVVVAFTFGGTNATKNAVLTWDSATSAWRINTEPSAVAGARLLRRNSGLHIVPL